MVANYTDNDLRKNLFKMLEVIDCMQPNPNNKTTEKEKMLMVEFFLLDEKRFGVYRFSHRAKESVIEKALEDINWKLTKRNIANKVYSLLDKGLLHRDVDREIFFKPWLFKVAEDMKKAFNNGESYELKFRFNGPSKH